MAFEIAREAQLVLACARGHPDEPTRERMAAFADDDLDWDLVIALANRHGLEALMHRHLPREIPMPKPVAARLWARSESIARRNRAMLAELKAILAEARAHSLNIVPYKGPALALATLGDVGLRESGDLDLLVARKDAPRARALLESRGYRTMHTLGADYDALWLASPRVYEMPMVDRARGFMAELQWSAQAGLALPAVDDPAWWSGLAECTLEDAPALAMGAEENLACLLVHGSKHAWSNLGWLVDIAEISRAGRIDWDELVVIVRRHAIARRAAVGLELARMLLQAPLPPPALELIRATSAAALAQSLVPGLLTPNYQPPSILGALRYEYAVADNHFERAKQIARTAFRPSPGDWQFWRLPRPLLFLYWPLRPVRLFAKYVLRIGSREAALPPRFENDDRHGIGEIEAPVPGTHRQA